MRHFITEKLFILKFFSRLWHQFHPLGDFKAYQFINWPNDWKTVNFVSLEFFPLKHSNEQLTMRFEGNKINYTSSSPRNKHYAHEETFCVYKFVKIILCERSTLARNVHFYPLTSKNLPCCTLRDFLRKNIVKGVRAATFLSDTRQPEVSLFLF